MPMIEDNVELIEKLMQQISNQQSLSSAAKDDDKDRMIFD
jgi:hypothetical protein